MSPAPPPDALCSIPEMRSLLAWCARQIGPCTPDAADARFHGRATVMGIRRGADRFFLKIHAELDAFEAEIHAYTHWTQAMAPHAPALIAVREHRPLALLLAALPGLPLEQAGLPMALQERVWETAGRVLCRLHEHAQGRFFGACRQDGRAAGPEVVDAVAYVSFELERDLRVAVDRGYLSDHERGILERAQRLLPAFAHERPVPCHRDYCPVNWIVSPSGEWAGVIDWEFSRWDVRVSDFARYPDWQWITQPNLVVALMRGYGRALTPQEERQLLVARAVYALGAIVWGHQASFHGFVREGQEALQHLDGLLPRAAKYGAG